MLSISSKTADAMHKTLYTTVHSHINAQHEYSALGYVVCENYPNIAHMQWTDINSFRYELLSVCDWIT